MAKYICRLFLNSKITYSMFISRRKCSSHAIFKANINNAREEVLKVSTLFVPGRYGNHVYQIVKPVIDIDYIADNIGHIKLSCDHRGIDLDLDYTLKVAREYLNIKNDHLLLVEKDQEYISKLTALNSFNLPEEMENVRNERKELTEKIIASRNKLYDIEDICMPLLQKVPHILHPSTPLQFSVVDACQEPPKHNFEVKSHMHIAESLSLLELVNNPSLYFLSGKLSEIELAIQMYFTDKMCSLGFSPLSCMDFCKSFIVEAIGYDPYSNQDSILLKCKEDKDIGQKLHLVGGASFETFCAYLSNMNVERTTLPMKYFSPGRRYNASYSNSKILDLFSVVQSTNVHCLILSELTSVKEFDLLLQAILTCYSELNVPYRMVNVAAKNLTVAESRRKQIELWSPVLKDYVPVAYVSQHDDFVSKRLQITYGQECIKEGYCNIVEGSVINIPSLIACIIENFQTESHEFNIPDVLQNYISSLYT